MHKVVGNRTIHCIGCGTQMDIPVSIRKHKSGIELVRNRCPFCKSEVELTILKDVGILEARWWRVDAD